MPEKNGYQKQNKPQPSIFKKGDKARIAAFFLSLAAGLLVGRALASGSYMEIPVGLCLFISACFGGENS